jgi:hypothetical protein
VNSLFSSLLLTDTGSGGSTPINTFLLSTLGPLQEKVIPRRPSSINVQKTGTSSDCLPFDALFSSASSSCGDPSSGLRDLSVTEIQITKVRYFT